MSILHIYISKLHSDCKQDKQLFYILAQPRLQILKKNYRLSTHLSILDRNDIHALSFGYSKSAYSTLVGF